MASDSAVRLKESWAAMPAEFFEPLTFGELEKYDRFICLPSPGDNHGHGGFRGTEYVFVKTEQIVTEAAPGLPYGIPHGGARNFFRGVPSDFPHSMFVIRIL